MPDGLHLTSHELRLFQAARQHGKKFIREVNNLPAMLESRIGASRVDALLRCASEHFGVPEISKRRDPLFKLLKSQGIHSWSHGYATRYYFSKHHDPKRIEVLTQASHRCDQIHFEIVSSTVKIITGRPESDIAGKSEAIPVLTINLLSS